MQSTSKSRLIGYTASRDTLASVPVPNRTASYGPIAHEQVIEELLSALPRFDLKADSEVKLASARDGAQMFGTLDVCNGVGDADWTFALGFRNSYDKSLPLGLCAGSRVFVCSNLAFSSEIVTRRKHTSRIEVRSEIERLLQMFVATKGRVTAEIEAMRNYELFTDAQAHDYVCQSVRNGAWPSSLVGKVLHEYHEPRHEAFRERSLWSLFNSYTEVGKERSAPAQVESTMQLQRMANVLTGIAR